MHHKIVTRTRTRISKLYVQDRPPSMQEFLFRIPLGNYDDNAVLDEEEKLHACLKEKHRKKLAP